MAGSLWSVAPPQKRRRVDPKNALKTAPEPPLTQVSLVINYDLPNNPENYLHRIGRSGRFGRKVSALLSENWGEICGMAGAAEVGRRRRAAATVSAALPPPLPARALLPCYSWLLASSCFCVPT